MINVRLVEERDKKSESLGKDANKVLVAGLSQTMTTIACSSCVKTSGWSRHRWCEILNGQVQRLWVCHHEPHANKRASPN